MSMSKLRQFVVPFAGRTRMVLRRFTTSNVQRLPLGSVALNQFRHPLQDSIACSAFHLRRMYTSASAEKPAQSPGFDVDEELRKFTEHGTKGEDAQEESTASVHDAEVDMLFEALMSDSPMVTPPAPAKRPKRSRFHLIEGPRKVLPKPEDWFAQRGLSPSIRMCDILMREYAKNFNFENAIELYEGYLGKHGIRPDDRITCSAMQAIARAIGKRDVIREVNPEPLLRKVEEYFSGQLKRYYDAIEEWKGMPEGESKKRFYNRKVSSAVPQLQTWNALLDAYSRSGLPKQAEQVLNDMREFSKAEGLSDIVPDTIMYTTLLSAWLVPIEAPDMTDVQRVLHEMRYHGCSSDQHTFTVLLRLCSKAREPERAFRFFEEMATLKVKPNKHAFDALMSCCAGLPEYRKEVDELVEWMEQSGYQLDRTSSKYLLAADALSGDVEKVLLRLRAVTQTPDSQPMNWRKVHAQEFMHLLHAYAMRIRAKSPRGSPPSSPSPSPSPSLSLSLPEKLQAVTAAQVTFDEYMAAKSAKPHGYMPRLWAALLGVYAAAGDLDGAMQVYDAMPLVAEKRSNAPERAGEVVQPPESGVLMMSPGRSTFPVLIALAAKRDDIASLLRIWSDIQSADARLPYSSYRTLAMCFLDAARFEHVVGVVERMCENWKAHPENFKSPRMLQPEKRGWLNYTLNDVRQPAAMSGKKLNTFLRTEFSAVFTEIAGLHTENADEWYAKIDRALDDLCTKV